MECSGFSFYFFVLSALLSLLGPQRASASPPTFSYQGRILKSDGAPLQYNNVSFEFRITSPDGSCILYREQKNGVDMTNSKGIFDTPIGAGTKLFPADPLFTLIDAFENSGTLNCEGGATYNPINTDGRLLRVQFHDGGGWKSISPDNIIRSVPFSSYAAKAATSKRLGTKTETDFVLKSAIPVCGTGYVLTSTTSGVLTCALDGGTQLADGAVTPNKLETVSGLTAGSYGNSSTVPVITVDTKGRITAISTNTVTGLPVASGVSGKFLKSNGTAWSGQDILFSDIKNSSGTSAFNVAACGANQTVAWASLTDSFTCQSIGSLDASAISSGTLNVARLPSSLTNGAWNGDGTNVYRTTGRVGVGTNTPSQELDVVGKVNATEFCIAGSCISSWPSGGGGTVTNIATGTGLTGGPITATGTISIANGGVGTTQIADGAVTQNKLETVTGLTAGAYGSATAVPSITVDAKGRVTAISTNSITGLPAASGVSGTFLKSNGTTWSGQNILFSDIKNSVGGSAFNVGSCAANQTVAWSSLTDSFTCQNIGSLDASAITAGTLDIARLPSAVTDGMWGASTGNVYRSTGNVGIGTSSPALKLSVNGEVQLSSTGAVCNSTNAGALQYASGTLQLCNGTNWTSLSGAPAGLVSAFSVNTCPAGWLEANGATVSRTTYSALFSAVGTTFGAGDGSTTFQLPDLRGEFIRGWDHGRGVDSGRTFGSWQVGSYFIQRDANNAGNGIQPEFSDDAFGSNASWDGGGGRVSAPYTIPGTSITIAARAATALSTQGATVATNNLLVMRGARPRNISLIYCVSTATNTSSTVASTGTGTTNYIPKWTSTTGLGNSILFDAGTGIGIGTTTPSQALDVAGKVNATEYCIAGSCINSWPSGGGSGTVTNIATGTGLTGGPITATGTIAIANGGVGTTQLADGAVTQSKLETVSGLTAGAYGSATAIPSITVDTKGRVTAISTNTITGLPSAGTSGKFLKSNGTTWSGQDILFSDIKNSVGGSAFNVASCAANQTVAWSSLTDSFTCQNIGSLDASAITAGTLDVARLPAAVTDGLWSSTSGNAYRSTGNVGVGTTSPVQLMQLHKSTAASSLTAYTNSSTGATLSDGSVVGIDATGNMWLWNQENLPVLFGTNNGERMRIAANGNVGIGTTSPSAKLEIGGTPGTDGIRFPDGTLQTTAASTIGVNNTFVSNWPDVIYCNDGSEYSILHIDTKESAATRVWYTKAAGGGAHYIRFNSSNGAFVDTTSFTGYSACNNKSISTLTSEGRTHNIAKGPAAQWLQSGNDAYYNAGKVGIGTSSPTAPLTLATASAVNGPLAYFSTPNTAGNWSYVQVDRGTYKSTFGIDPNGNAHVFAGPGQATTFWANGTQHAILNTSGNFGVGTGSPQGRFDSNITDGVWAYAVSRSGTMLGGLHGNSGVLNLTALAGNPLTLQGNGGKVGIGMTNPSQALEVNGRIKTASSATDCVGGWDCTAYFWDMSVASIYYSGLTQRSDRRLKENITPLKDEYLDRLEYLNPVTYTWKDPKNGHGTKFGLIAQEVESVWPEIVSTADDEMKTKSVDYTQLISPLLRQAQESRKFNREVQSVIESLEQSNRDKDKEIAELKARLEKIEKALGK
ncbi:hypothetical protein AZI86_11360 [Bdellovibrio bacteriovorus]|uniref:Peptidase S74 domain-containing protein n=1 Tax=Bdellovibrio bacteriovorus TaxID=959 RepID=A0A150WLT8_BDEBC|nr:tail fiber protein [Bdellovibrio bacteriovorus]KYG64795.1 hypothetical protein AZI86_11360 [Bdellovibrio bacteriovorus]